MKFCYLDESKKGKDGVFLMAGVVVDAQRMHRTKSECRELFHIVGNLARRSVTELHATDLIPGNGAWHGIDGHKRTAIVDAILDWFVKRKHKVTFAAIDTMSVKELPDDDERKGDLKTDRIAAAFHIVLTLQRAHQKETKNKGHTIFVFDRGKEPVELESLFSDPPSWTDSYYDLKRGKQRLDQIIDVPYYARSHRVPLIQLADLICYILRRYSELKDSGSEEAYPGELARYEGWIAKIELRFIGRSQRYLAKGPCDTSKFFTSLAPTSLTKL